MISRAARFALCLFTLPALLGTVLTQKRIATPIIPPEIYSAMRWRMIGPHRGGRVLAVRGVRGHPDTFYFGAGGGARSRFRAEFGARGLSHHRRRQDLAEGSVQRREHRRN